jgi:photosystem II stability/assembly factor-like uncharacterized protein
VVLPQFLPDFSRTQANDVQLYTAYIRFSNIVNLCQSLQMVSNSREQGDGHWRCRTIRVVKLGKTRPVTSLTPGRRRAIEVLLAGAIVACTLFLEVVPASGVISSWRVERVVGNGEAIADISCYSASRCVGVSIGSSQVSLSKDDGAHWSALRGPREASLGFTSLDCVKPAVCFATVVLGSLAPGGGAVLESVDGGHHWRVDLSRAKPKDPNYRMNDVSCVGANSCLVTGTTGATGFIFFTRDGGREWNNSRLAVQPAHGVINGATCVTTTQCLAGQGAGAYVYRSLNGGRDWTIVRPPPTFTSYESEKGVLTGISALSCGSAKFCVAGGFIAQTQLQGTTEPFSWVSHDGGITWSFTQPFAATGAKSPSAISIGAISCTSALACELGLSYGYIYSTSNGGVTWVRDLGAPDADSNVLSLACVEPTRCIGSVISNFPSHKLFEGSLWIHP